MDPADIRSAGVVPTHDGRLVAKSARCKYVEVRASFDDSPNQSLVTEMACGLDRCFAPTRLALAQHLIASKNPLRQCGVNMRCSHQGVDS